MRVVGFLVVFVALVVCRSMVVKGHSPPQREGSLSFSETSMLNDTFESYHIHVQFLDDRQYGNASVGSALRLRQQFIDTFDPVGPCHGFYDQRGLCMFDTVIGPDGPFVGPQWAAYIPQELYSVTVQWIMRHRGLHSVLIHPNSGYPYQDHHSWSLWGGEPWPIVFAIFNETVNSTGESMVIS